MICWVDVVHEFFPGASVDECKGILWEYTGFPTFWTGDPVTECRHQLEQLRDLRGSTDDTHQ